MDLRVIVVLILTLFIGYKYITLRYKYLRAVKRKLHGRRREFIYFFRANREPFWRIKIGRTNNLSNRSKSHATANPYGITLLATFRCEDDVKAETYIHNLFKNQRINREWFTLTPKMIFFMHIVNDKKLTKEFSNVRNKG